MEPEMRDGDHVVVDTARRSHATGELFVPWDANGLVVKRVEVTGDEPPRLRLLSANADYQPYTCLAEEAHIVGKVVWMRALRNTGRKAWMFSAAAKAAKGMTRVASSMQCRYRHCIDHADIRIMPRRWPRPLQVRTTGRGMSA